MFKFNKKSTVFISILSIFLATAVSAAGLAGITDSFRQYKNVQNLDILVPTVVELPIEDIYLERQDFVVIDQTTATLLPYYYKKIQL